MICLDKHKMNIEDVQKIGDKLKVDWNNISIEDLKTGIEIEKEHKGLLKFVKGLTPDEMYARIAIDHLKESPEYYKELKKMEKKLKNENIIRIAKLLIKEMINDEEFYHKLRYEADKNDSEYNKAYHEALGMFKCDSPDQLSKEKKIEFFNYIDGKLIKKEGAYSSGVDTTTHAKHTSYVGGQSSYSSSMKGNKYISKKSKSDIDFYKTKISTNEKPKEKEKEKTPDTSIDSTEESPDLEKQVQETIKLLSKINKQSKRNICQQLE
jgi:hypothetical protein